MSGSGGDDRNGKLLDGEISGILAEIEHILRELERSASATRGENLSNRLETIEQKLGNLETLLGGIVPNNASVRLNDLMEQVIASRIRADLESSLHALHMVQSYLHDDLKSARTPVPPSGIREEEERRVDIRTSPGDDRSDAGNRDRGELLDRIIRHAGPEDRDAVSKLSKRRRDVLYHLLMGKRNREISKELGITEKTVKNNLSMTYKILRVKSRTELIHRLLNPLTEESTV